MRSRAGPLAVLFAIACLSFASMGCASTRDKLGGVVSAAGDLVSATGGILQAVGDAILNGPAVDAKSASDALGLTEPDLKAAPALPPLPVQPAGPPAGPSGALPHEEDLTAPDPRQVTSRVLNPFDERLRRDRAVSYSTANRAPALFRRT